MNAQHPPQSGRRARIALEVVTVVIIAIALKAALDLWNWRISGPVSLLILLAGLTPYLIRVDSAADIFGLRFKKSIRSFALAPLQVIATMVAVIGTGVAVGTIGEQIGILGAPSETGSLERFGDLHGDLPLYLGWLAVLWFAGPAEELVFRAYLVTRIGAALGGGKIGALIAVIVAAVLFGLGHVYYQGVRGLVITGAIGLVLGLLFLIFKRNIWPLMIGHAAVNTLVFTALYAGWEI